MQVCQWPGTWAGRAVPCEPGRGRCGGRTMVRWLRKSLCDLRCLKSLGSGFSKVGCSPEVERTRNVGIRRCCGLRDSNSQRLHNADHPPDSDRFKLQVLRLRSDFVLASRMCQDFAVLRMESRLLLRRGSLICSWQLVGRSSSVHGIRLSFELCTEYRGRRWHQTLVREYSEPSKRKKKRRKKRKLGNAE